MTSLKPLTCYIQWFGKGKRWLFNGVVSYRVVKGPMLNLFLSRDGGDPRKVQSVETGNPAFCTEGYNFSLSSGLPGKPDLVFIQGEEIKRIFTEEGLIKEPEPIKGGWNGVD